ncbi:MAG: tetratricopeptide repeat protein [Planctomycetes bacterium]|nr:tetratricopeptide repeat protein [Planctomycetota bacterium]
MGAQPDGDPPAKRASEPASTVRPSGGNGPDARVRPAFDDSTHAPEPISKPPRPSPPPGPGRAGHGPPSTLRPSEPAPTLPAGDAAAAPLPSAAGAAAASGPGPAGEPFGRYRLLRELGRGGMGVVYQAWDTDLRRTVALKMLLPEAAESPQAVERFLVEARAAGRLRHPNIVQVHEAGSFRGRHFLAMDFIEGRTLEAARRELPTRRMVEVLREAALALHAAHCAGVVHRDVKPGNILLDASGRPYVSDFGLAKEVAGAEGRGLTVSGAIMGTPQYMSPEQAAGKGREISGRSDVWSLGVLLYEHLAGRPPFEGEGFLAVLLAIANKEPEPPSRIARRGVGRTRRADRRVPSDLETICMTCLEKDPKRRYASAESLAVDLGRFLEGEPISARPLSAPARLVRRALKHRWIVGPTAVAIGLGLAFFAYAQFARADRLRRIEAGVVAGEAARKAGRAADARDAYRSVLELDPADAVAIAGLAWADAEVKSAAAALAAEKKKAEGHGEADQILVKAEGLWRDAKLVLYRADVPIARYHEKLATALRLYDDALARAPDYGWIYESRGRIRIQAYDLAGAEEDLRHAAELLGPEHGKAAHRSLARVFIERSFDSRYLSRTGKRAEGRRAQEAFCRLAASELEQSGGDIEWRGSQEEEEALRRQVEGFLALARGEVERGRRILAEGVERATDEECAWALTSATNDPGELDRWLEAALRMRPRFARALAHRGMVKRQKGELDGALADYDAAILVAPRFSWAYLGRGSVRKDRKEPAEAFRDFDAAIRLDPKLALGYNNRGLNREDGGDLAGALSDYEEAIRLDPNDCAAFVNRGALRTRTGDRAGARQDFDEAIKLEPTADAYRNRGILRLESKDADGAIADLGEAIRLEPKDPLLFVARSSAEREKGDTAAALADLDAAERLAPLGHEAALARGNTHRDAGDLPAAIRDYDALIAQEPARADAWLARGYARGLNGDRQGAIADYDQAIRLDPKEPKGYLNRGLLKKQSGDRAGAIADYDQVLRLEPAMVQAFLNRASARFAGGDAAGAIGDYDAAMKLEPENAVVRHGRGVVRRSRGDLAGAIADFDEAIKLAPDSPVYYNERSMARRDRGDLAGSLADCEQALRLDPRHVNAIVNRGICKAMKGDLDGGLADFDQAVRLDPQHVAARHSRGLARDMKGDAAGAIAEFNEALRLDPSQAESLFARGNVRAKAGELASGLADFDQVLRLNPRHVNALMSRGTTRLAAGDAAGASADYRNALEIAPAGWPLRGQVEALLRKANAAAQGKAGK